MDFNKILIEWEKEKKKQKKQTIMDSYIDNYLPGIKNKQEKEQDLSDISPGRARQKRLKMKPQRSLDLHGMRILEACKIVDRFLLKCKKDRIEKVLIIHGKGKHSKEPFILAKKIKEYIQNHPLTGEFGIPEKKLGGSGALWVLIRV